MAVFDRYVIKMLNDNVSATNYEQFGIECNLASNGVLQGQGAAQIIAYIAKNASAILANDSQIAAIMLTPSGTNLGVNIPFPVTEYAALKVLDAALPTMTAYGVAIGASGGLAPLGTSIVVTEYTNVGGPAGRGRHFFPFYNKAKVDGNGLADSASRAAVVVNYSDWILGDGAFAVDGLTPLVVNALGTTTKAVLSVKAQPILSNLRSRRR